MASFAKIGRGSIVERVESVSDDIATTEQAGVDFLNNLYGTNDIWKQTYTDGSTRKNFAGIGMTFYEDRDAFVPIQPFASWILNETTCKWEAPVAYPTDGQSYSWNETTKQWDLNE
jgi:hypothetical protein